MTARTPFPPEAVDLLRALAPSISRALRALPERPAAGVVVMHQRADVADVVDAVGALRRTDAGDHYAAAPLARVRALAEQLAPSVAPRLAEQLAPGETWCLVIGPTSAGVMPIVKMTTAPTRRGQA